MALNLPPLVQALLIVVAAVVVGKILQWIFTRWLKSLTRHTTTLLDDHIVSTLERPVFATATLVGLILATYRLQLKEAAEHFTLGILASLLVLVWLVTGFRLAGLLLDALSRNRRRFPAVEERTIPLFNTLAKVFLVGGAVWAILMIWRIDARPWLTSAGIVGIAVGFAAKDTLANLFSGVFIVADAPYKLGDFVILDSGERGRVTQVGLRSTRLLTRDDIEIIIPNAVIANAKIINESGGPWLKERLRIAVGVAYGSDLDQVCALLKEIAQNHDHVCATPEPRVRFRSFGDSALNLELLCWIDEPVLRGRMLHELNLEVYKGFQQHGVQIPFPQRDVHIHNPTPAPEKENTLQGGNDAG
ncbi:MAG: mechanosensitive ion channel family protein [Acidobacteriota bacterium]|nr:mechanosensitive ion channel family protein [Acidobacteriota bacterium]